MREMSQEEEIRKLWEVIEYLKDAIDTLNVDGNDEVSELLLTINSILEEEYTG